jgi:hypothetical protein
LALIEFDPENLEDGASSVDKVLGVFDQATQTSEWRGVAFEMKTHPGHKRGEVLPFKATEQLIDYKTAGFIPVIISTNKLLHQERDGLTLRESVHRIGGASVAVELNQLNKTVHKVLAILDMCPSFTLGDLFARRVDLTLGYPVSNLFELADRERELWDLIDEERIREKLSTLVRE